MKDDIRTELDKFERLECCAQKGGAVFLGSTFWTRIPVSELAQDYPIDMPVYNRSVQGLRVGNAEPFIETVSHLEPARIFVGLGDADLESNDFDISSFLISYEWLLYTLHNRCGGKICILSIVSMSPHTANVNNALRRLAADTGCCFIDISQAMSNSSYEIKAFEIVKRHFLPQMPRFEDVFFSLR